ncbi:hypothetical protein HG530_009305 [Fusarium avenaceum]|nr:hypothetical protein HG530_009305 [Fusarium avenaceum]
MATGLLGTILLSQPRNEGVKSESLRKSIRVLLSLTTSSRQSGNGSLRSGSGSNLKSLLGRGSDHRGHKAGGDRSRGNRSGCRDGAVGRGTRNDGLRARARPVQSRSGDLVCGGTLVRVEENTRLRVGVELCGQSTLGVVSTRASDVDVEALGVVLGTILGASAVKGNDLVTEDVASSGKSLGDGAGPGVVVLDKIGCSPGAVESSGIDLNPLKGSRVRLGALSSALGDVSQDRSDVRLGPVRPLELNRTTSLDGERPGSGGSLLVAGNVRGTEVARRDEAVVEVLGRPSSNIGDLATVLGQVVRVKAVAGLVDAIDLDTSHGTVGEGDGGKSANESSSDFERHSDLMLGF